MSRARGLVAPCAACLLLAAGPASAQIEEIRVTAERREAALQDVPLAVSAFQADQIEKLQIDVTQDIGENVPNLQTYTVTAGAQAMQLHARGASVQNPGFNASESPIGLYVDEVYRGRLASANLDLTDLERIEVLRGPQATLYGRNTLAGAIKLVTRTPGDETWANASLGYGSYDTVKLTGALGGPLREGSLAGSISLLYDDRGEGWQDNPILGTEPGEYENRAGRIKLHWYGSERLDVQLSAFAVDVENDGYNGIPYVPFSTTSDPPVTPGDTTPGEPLGDFYDNFSPAGANYGATDQSGATLTWSYDFGGAELRSITGYVTIDDEFGFDLAGGGAAGFPGANGLLVNSDSTIDQTSQELQLLGSAFGERLDWILGAFYLNEDGDQDYRGFLEVPTPDGPLTIFDFRELTATETDSYALFAEGSYRLTDRLALTVGARWTEDQKTYRNECRGSTCSPGDGAVATLDEDFDETTFKVGLDYQIADNQLVYLLFAQGFQAGGFQTLCFGNITASCAGSFYEPQTVDSFEAGYKADLFENRLRLNLAAFYAMYDDIQQTALNPAGNNFPVQNVGEVDVFGVELELLWSPIERINVFAVAGYLNDDYGDINPLSSVALTGADDLPSSPDYTVKAGFDYAVPMTADLEFRYGFDYFYTDEYFTEVTNALLVPSYGRLNGFFAIGDTDGRWQATLSAKNILDDDDYVSGIYFDGVTNIRTALPPAEYMLSVRLSY